MNSESVQDFRYDKAQVDSIAKLLIKIPRDKSLQCDMLENPEKTEIIYFPKNEEKIVEEVHETKAEPVPEQPKVVEDNNSNLDSWLDKLLG